MITYSIKAPSKNIVSAFMDNLLSRRGQQQQHPNMRALPPPPDPSPVRGGYMDKITFIKFVEGIKVNYKIGDRVTFVHQEEKLNQLPTQWYTLNDINELHGNCVMDPSVGEPRIMFVRNVNFRDVSETGFAVAPCRLRQLSEQENRLADLQNRPTQGTA